MPGTSMGVVTKSNMRARLHNFRYERMTHFFKEILFRIMDLQIGWFAPRIYSRIQRLRKVAGMPHGPLEPKICR